MNRSIRKLLWGILSLSILFLGLFIYREYFYTFSNGYRIGILQKISNDGSIIKTYKGEMILTRLADNQNVEIASQKFYFTIISKNLANQLITKQGQMVIVHYQKKNGTLFWRSDSPYLVDGVKH